MAIIADVMASPPNMATAPSQVYSSLLVCFGSNPAACTVVTQIVNGRLVFALSLGMVDHT
jgi:hypothetical protein